MGFVTGLLGILLFLTAVFLIVLVLIQRGKGGGLAGAFGGMGGQSAFGTKAGDLFTRITVGVAAFWIIFCIICVKVFGIGGKGPLAGGSFGRRSKRKARRHRPAAPASKLKAAKERPFPAPVRTPAISASAWRTCRFAAAATRRRHVAFGEDAAISRLPERHHTRDLTVLELPALLQSMTGFGEAHFQQDGLAVAVEVRTINNRFFKLTVRAGEGYASLDALVESVVREAVHRGTIQVNIRVDRRRSPDDYRINVEVLERYRQQLVELAASGGASPSSPRWRRCCRCPA